MSNPVLPPVPEISRTEPDLQTNERTSLRQWLDYQRATFLLKCHGLSDAQLKQRSTPPSSLSLLGLARHLTEVERGWFEQTLAGQPRSAPTYYSKESPDGDFDDLDSHPVAEVWQTYAAVVARSREIYDSFGDPGELSRATERPTRTVRWVMTHLIEEYARHNGHADLLREAIDGSRGE